MKKYFKITICVLILTAILVIVSCNRQEREKTVRIWCYEYDDEFTDYDFNGITEKALDYIKNYANNNDIKLEIFKYSYKDLKYEDYVLKRNTALEYGDADILLDKIDSLYPIKKYAGDYTKLDTYENILENFRGQFCLPIAYDMRSIFISNETIKKYNIETEKIITVREYYNIKQKMKVAGAIFKLNAPELKELVNYYMLKNNLCIIVDNEKYSLNKDIMMHTIDEIYADIKKYYDEGDIIETEVNNYTIRDKNTNCDLSRMVPYMPALNTEEYKGRLIISDYTIAVIDDEYVDYGTYRNAVPCIFINKNTRNDHTYKIAGLLFNDSFQSLLYDSGLVGVITDTQNIMKYIGFDEGNGYTGKKTKDSQGNEIRINKYYPKDSEEQLFEMIERAYKMLREKNTYTFFTDNSLENNLQNFIFCEIADMYNGKQKDNLDKRIDDFTVNLNLYYN